MPIAPTIVSPPPRSFDADGRALRLTPEEMEQRAAQARQALELLKNMGEEDEQRETLEYLSRAVDEDRLSDRARFGS
jgi:hypothetical protein